VAEVAAQDGSSGLALHRNEEVASAAGEVENTRIGSMQDVTNAADSDAAPVFIDVGGEEVVGQIVAVGDTTEHAPHPA
jgi:hypothetical protein